MKKVTVCAGVLAGLLWSASALSALAGQPAGGWLDNERKFKSDDPALNVRRSEHFRILWGKGAGKEKPENADFSRVTEELVQGNLQMLEQLWHRLHDPEPRGMGFHVPAQSFKPEHQDGKSYRANLVMNNTGIWAGGAWGACDEWGFPLYALPPAYLRFDPPSGATPHEYGHTVIINAGGFNETPYDGMWHEATANWLQLQFNNSYPGPGGVGTQPFLSVPHGRNYYDSWQIWEYQREDPRYGYAFITKVWTQARGNKAKGAEYMFDAMARLDTSGSPDAYNAIKDALGRMAAKNVMWDYERQPYFQKQSPRTTDPFAEMYRRAYTELERRAGDATWFRVPFAHAPMQGGYNVVPIALEGKKGGGYTVTVDFRPLWDATRGSDWRATLVAVSDGGDSRYSTMWNQGRNAITLAADENRLFLAVAATPDFMPFEGFSRPLISDLPLQPQGWEVAFVDTQATAYESRPARPEGVAGKPHANGGGFVADTATVEPTAYVGPDAMVLASAKVLGRARVEDFAVVTGKAVVQDDARASGHALVADDAQVSDRGKVRDWATVRGRWKVYENGRALERAYLHDKGELHGHATIKGNVPDYGGANVQGHAIKDGDCANSAGVDHQVLLCWVWGIDQKYADERPDTGGLYCRYAFTRASPIYALDHFGVMHGYLVGGPRTVRLDDKACPGALELDGKDQYVELKRDVADFGDTTFAVWVNWAGGEADQRILHVGDGADRYLYLTPKDAAGKARFAISTSGTKGEQSLVAPAALPAGTWTHVAVTLKGDTAA
ncbi:MAG: LamG domain-containing protein, partial [Acidobacteria bacterium]|nr:LamG domain-containing protein [Acidobacteriota bacterium]